LRRREAYSTTYFEAGDLMQFRDGLSLVEWDFTIHGVEHEQYFRGASSGDYEHVVVGIGSTCSEALEDALEGAATGFSLPDGFIGSVEAWIESLASPDNPNRVEVEQAQDGNFPEGIYVYASIRWSDYGEEDDA
jgi:hypothetical protein